MFFVSHLFYFCSIIPMHYIYFLSSKITGFYWFCVYFFHSYVRHNCFLSLVSVIKYTTSKFTYITRATSVNQVCFARIDVKATCCKCRYHAVETVEWEKSQVLLICVMQIYKVWALMLSYRLTSLLFGKLGSLPLANGLIEIFDCMCLFLVQHVVKCKQRKAIKV